MQTEYAGITINEGVVIDQAAGSERTETQVRLNAGQDGTLVVLIEERKIGITIKADGSFEVRQLREHISGLEYTGILVAKGNDISEQL